jgi:hypothetical protein
MLRLHVLTRLDTIGPWSHDDHKDEQASDGPTSASDVANWLAI